MVAHRPYRRFTVNEQLLLDAERTHAAIEEWSTTLNTLIMAARAETDVREGVTPDDREQ